MMIAILCLVYISAFLADCSGDVILECVLTHAAREYQGTMSRTKDNYPCQRWDSQEPNNHIYNNPVSYPDETVSDAADHCRNPDQNWAGGTWCYTDLPNRRWQSCEISFCDCKTEALGSDYMGTLSETVSGLRCQNWDSLSPHPHNFTHGHQFPDLDLLDADDYCRNPLSSRPNGPWCYTLDPSVLWEYCTVGFCEGYPVSDATTTEPTTTTTAPHVSPSSSAPPVSSTTSPTTTRHTPTSALPPSTTTPTSTPPTGPITTHSTHPTTTTLSSYSTSQETGGKTTESSGKPIKPTPVIKGSTSQQSGGSVAGIVVGVLLTVVLIAGAIGVGVWWRYFRSPRDRLNDKAILDNFENPLYNKNKGPVGAGDKQGNTSTNTYDQP